MPERLKNLKIYIKGDPALAGIGLLLVLISFAVVFSTSSNLVNIYQTHSHWFYLLKHTILIATAIFLFIVSMHLPVEYLRKSIPVLMILTVLLLVYTLFFGISANGDTARRWIKIPFATIQPSFIAMYVLMIFTADFLDKIKNKKTTLLEDFKTYWAWVFLSIGLIMPANNSTAALILGMIFIILFVGGYSFGKLTVILLTGIALIGIYYGLAKAFPRYIPNRFETAESRIKEFLGIGDDEKKAKKVFELDQPTRAKMAIASGGLIRWAPGKSVQKNMLSQSSSDFVYAVIIEEYGVLLGGIGILFLYLFLFVRIWIIAYNLKSYFKKILVLALGLPIIIQALINMSVATGLIPVTGQPLPLISMGGTSIMMTGLILGIIVKISEDIYEDE